MNTSSLRAAYAVMSALAMLSLVSPSSAQQNAAPAAQQTPAQPQPAAVPAQAAPPAPAAAVTSVPAPGSDASATPSGDGKGLKAAATGLRELSPWSMFMSADILVKAVMIGLAFASLVTWTIFIAKLIELSLVRRGLRAALGKIGDARSLAEAQFALGAQD